MKSHQPISYGCVHNLRKQKPTEKVKPLTHTHTRRHTQIYAHAKFIRIFDLSLLFLSAETRCTVSAISVFLCRPAYPIHTVYLSLSHLNACTCECGLMLWLRKNFLPQSTKRWAPLSTIATQIHTRALIVYPFFRGIGCTSFEYCLPCGANDSICGLSHPKCHACANVRSDFDGELIDRHAS